jgi:predicted DNA-binding transcriptional regulator AlpA
VSRRYLRPNQAAEFIGVSRSTLAKMRVYGTGPQYAKLGRSVIYPHDKLEEYVAARLRSSTSISTDQNRGRIRPS